MVKSAKKLCRYVVRVSRVVGVAGVVRSVDLG